MDVDGVLTDGRLYVSQDGTEWKTFHTHDGHGIRLGQRCGLGFGILSGRESRVVARRAEELRITEVHQRVFDKGALLGPILARIGLSGDAVCYIGDDLVDLPVMRRVGLAVAPADARPEVIEAAHYVTARRGGRGAVREAIELVLRARGEWDKLAAGNP
jgi:3-deoxy-D-manno-octulosonate 8-phosphate phosphatase (KDO 8-P phosphatase)